MLDLSRKLHDELVLDCGTFPLNLAFDVVLKMIAMLADSEVPQVVKGYFALLLLTGENFEDRLSLEESFHVLKLVIEEHIQPYAYRQKVTCDVLGNPLPIRQTEIDSEKKEPLFSFKHDGEYIFASFMQAYGIDLFDAQGRLHWRKFNALLNGLPEDTKFMQVLKIRSWKANKHDSAKYKEEMRRLQVEYALPDDSY